jgi:hypothetical protein
LGQLAFGLSGSAFGQDYLPALFESEEDRKLPVAARILWIKTNSGSKLCTVPHEQFYGILGLVGVEGLPNELLPSYRQPYEEVFERYTRYIIEHTNDLRLMMFIEPLGSKLHLSWTCNFQSHHLWGPKPELPHTGYITSDGKGLAVDGSKCNTVISHLPLSNSVNAPARLLRFYDECVSLAAEIARAEKPTI